MGGVVPSVVGGSTYPRPFQARQAAEAHEADKLRWAEERDRFQAKVAGLEQEVQEGRQMVDPDPYPTVLPPSGIEGGPLAVRACDPRRAEVGRRAEGHAGLGALVPESRDFDPRTCPQGASRSSTERAIPPGGRPCVVRCAWRSPSKAPVRALVEVWDLGGVPGTPQGAAGGAALGHLGGGRPKRSPQVGPAGQPWVCACGRQVTATAVARLRP